MSDATVRESNFISLTTSSGVVRGDKEAIC